MLSAAHPSPAVAWLRPALLGLAGLQLATGAAMLLAPRTFYDAVADFGPYNGHDLRDFATFYLAGAVALCVAAERPSWRAPVVALVGLQYVLHTGVHVLDVGDADPSWVGPLDIATLALGALAFGALYRVVAREEAGR